MKIRNCALISKNFDFSKNLESFLGFLKPNIQQKNKERQNHEKNGQKGGTVQETKPAGQ